MHQGPVFISSGVQKPLQKNLLHKIRDIEDCEAYGDTIEELCSETILPWFAVEVLYAVSDLQNVTYSRIEADIKKLRVSQAMG